MITKDDIPSNFLFILDSYGATERFLKRVNEQGSQLSTASNFRDFLSESFGWPILECFYWDAVAYQDEEEITKQSSKLDPL